MDYYAVLDLKPGCTNDDIKAQYRRLARECHPDVNPDDRAGATDRLRTINEAYAVLSNPLKRRRYDEKRSGAVSTGAKTSPPRRPRVYDNVGPMSAEDLYRARNRQNSRNLILAVIVFVCASSVYWHYPRTQPIDVSAPASTQPYPSPPPMSNIQPASPTVAATPAVDPTVSQLINNMDRLQLEVDLVLQHAQERYDAARHSATTDATRLAAIDRLANDLQELRSIDATTRADVESLRDAPPGPTNVTLVHRATDELQQTVLAGRNVVSDVRALNGTTRETP